MSRKLLFSVCALLLAGACRTTRPTTQSGVATGLPQIQREFRAAWVATVANINWPSKPGLPVEIQQNEAIRLLDLLSQNHFNAVVFQIRPQCDALYQSALEPWSYYLTGKQGQAPDPYYDPLEFWINEAHKRGLELHVWLNPYRAHHTAGGEITEHSIVSRRPELAVQLKNGMWWLDPAKEETQDHSYQVVMDIVSRYDIDGVHFDDYFYPYPSYNENEDFPDDDTYRNYQNKGGKLTQEDWRREKVNGFIKRLYKGIKKEKKHVKFGISPFGIWQPGYPAGIEGFNQYDQLYADAKLWLNKGWIDYFAPQLYWPINQIPQSYPVLLEWWRVENLKNRHLWPGINIGRFQGTQAGDETINQIMIARALLQSSPGVIHWSIGPLQKNDSLAQQILSGPYRSPALVPPSPWLSGKRPGTPTLILKEQQTKTTLEIEADSEFRQVVIYYLKDSKWNSTVLPCDNCVFDVGQFTPYMMESRRLLISIIDRFGQESRPALFDDRYRG